MSPALALCRDVNAFRSSPMKRVRRVFHKAAPFSSICSIEADHFRVWVFSSFELCGALTC